jgi:ribosome-associated protein
MEQPIVIHNRLSIAAREFRFRFSRSSGPGGQHVNKTETRVELLFNVRTSPSLTEKQREQIERKLGSRISADGILSIAAQGSRSQTKNREIALTRFRKLLQKALQKTKKRIPTKPSKVSSEKRIQRKKRRGDIKKSRRSLS